MEVSQQPMAGCYIKRMSNIPAQVAGPSSTSANLRSAEKRIQVNYLAYLIGYNIYSSSILTSVNHHSKITHNIFFTLWNPVVFLSFRILNDLVKSV